jgi:hypothetical protein
LQYHPNTRIKPLAFASSHGRYSIPHYAQDRVRAQHVNIYLRRYAEWFTREQTRAARKAGPNRAAFGRAAKHLHSQQHRSYQRSRGQHGMPVPPLQAGSFVGPLTAPLAMLLPELRRKESSAKLKAKAEKTSAAIYFDYPGSWISANKDARKCMGIKE